MYVLACFQASAAPRPENSDSDEKDALFGGLDSQITIFAELIVIYAISGIKAILQDSSVKIADDEGVSPSSSVITRVSCNML
jgi:hypothetical protein